MLNMSLVYKSHPNPTNKVLYGQSSNQLKSCPFTANLLIWRDANTLLYEICFIRRDANALKK
jgi:hypothetical protein